MSILVNNTTIINGGGYGSLCGLGRCRSFTPYFQPLFGGGWGGYCCNPIAPLAVMGGVAIGMNLPTIGKGIWAGIKGIGQGLAWAGTGLAWLGAGAWKGISAAGKAVGKAVGSAASWVGNGVAKLATGAWNGIKNFFGWIGRGFKSK